MFWLWGLFAISTLSFANEAPSILNIPKPNKVGIAVVVTTQDGIYSLSQITEALEKVESQLKASWSKLVGNGFVKFPYVNPKGEEDLKSYLVGHLVESPPKNLPADFHSLPGMVGFFARVKRVGDPTKINYEQITYDLSRFAEKSKYDLETENWEFFINGPKTVPTEKIYTVTYYKLTRKKEPPPKTKTEHKKP